MAARDAVMAERKLACAEAEAEERDRRKRGRRGRRGSDPVEALGEGVMGLVMELLDARSVARCTAVSLTWYGVAADNRLWAPKVRPIPAGISLHASLGHSPVCPHSGFSHVAPVILDLASAM
jgi:hypothetical protein